MEVTKIFAGFFMTMIPAIAISLAGASGALSPLITLTTGQDGQPLKADYFRRPESLSSFLDNAPIYQVFFNAAGDDAHALMNAFPQTLSAIGCGAVFMGANAYIGDAPNLMARSIA
jgi:Na+/H+ antiporter NhaD/arsenite permease-like protein